MTGIPGNQERMAASLIKPGVYLYADEGTWHLVTDAATRCGWRFFVLEDVPEPVEYPEDEYLDICWPVAQEGDDECR